MSPTLNDAARAVLTSGHLAHLVTLNADGSPQVSCVYVTVDGDDIVSGHLGDHLKLRNVRRDGRVALTVEAAGDGLFKPYLAVTGTAQVEVGGAPEMLRRITREQLGPESEFPPPGAPEGFVLRITPTHVHGTGPWTVP